MWLFDFFQGKKKQNNEKEIVASKNNTKSETIEKYIKQISNLSNQGMPIDQIIVRFFLTIEDFPVDPILNNLSSETIKQNGDEIFVFEDGSKTIRTKNGLNSLKKINTAETAAADEMSKIVVEIIKKENPIHGLLEKEEFVNNLDPEVKEIKEVNEVKEIIQEKVKEVKKEKKKRNSRFSMR